MKKIIAVILNLAFMLSVFRGGVEAQNTYQYDDDTNGTVESESSAMKIFKKFSIPIAAICALAGADAFMYYKYKNPSLTITGEVTEETVNGIFTHIRKFKNENRGFTLIFKNATIKEGAFKNKEFDCNIKFVGTCKIEQNSCENTCFSGNVEIKGNILAESSFKGATFKERDLIVNAETPISLFAGALAKIPETPGAKYKMPGEPAIIYNGQNLDAVRAYLEEFFK